MFCDRCGSQLSDATNFCPGCGKPARVTPLVPVQSRLAGHVRLLGIFWLALSGFHLLPGLALMSIFGHGMGFMRGTFGMPGFVGGFLTVIGWIFLASAILGLITGWGLLQREPWARTLAIVMGCFSLLNLPFGTALGIYTLWVLLPSASEQEYRSVARAA